MNSDKETVVDDGSEGLVAGFRWSPDGRNIAYTKTKSTPYYSLVGIFVASIEGEHWPLPDTEGVVGVSWSPDSTQLAYSVPVVSGDPTVHHADVFVVGFDGSRRKFSDAGGILGWSPDGRFIAYWKDEHGGSAAVGDIAVIDVDTGSEAKLGAFTGDERPQWAPDPVRHIFHNLQLDTDGGTAVELFERPGAVLSWSPDTSKVAYVEGSPFGAGLRSLVVLDLVAGQRTAFHTSQADIAHAASPGYYGEWSPDSRYFAFLAFESDQDAVRLYVADTLTGKATPVAGPPGSGEFASYSPDSQWLLIQVGYNSQAPSLWVADPDGSAPKKVADGVALIGGPGLAPWRPAD